MRVHWTTWLYKDCTGQVRRVLQLCYHSATFSYSALLAVDTLTLCWSIPCIYCALAVTQSDIAWHTLMLILLSQSLLSYQHVPACIYTPARPHNVLYSPSSTETLFCQQLHPAKHLIIMELGQFLFATSKTDQRICSERSLNF